MTKTKTKVKAKDRVVKRSAPAKKVGIKPTGDRVLIKESLSDVHEKTASGIFIPVSTEKDSGAKRGVVIAIGPGKIEDGKKIALSVSVGDTVLFQWGEKVVIDSEEYFVVRDAEIMAIVN
jgi:chaperonin GroES